MTALPLFFEGAPEARPSFLRQALVPAYASSAMNDHPTRMDRTAGCDGATGPDATGAMHAFCADNG